MILNHFTKEPSQTSVCEYHGNRKNKMLCSMSLWFIKTVIYGAIEIGKIYAIWTSCINMSNVHSEQNLVCVHDRNNAGLSLKKHVCTLPSSYFGGSSRAKEILLHLHLQWCVPSAKYWCTTRHVALSFNIQSTWMTILNTMTFLGTFFV